MIYLISQFLGIDAIVVHKIFFFIVDVFILFYIFFDTTKDRQNLLLLKFYSLNPFVLALLFLGYIDNFLILIIYLILRTFQSSDFEKRVLKIGLLATILIFTKPQGLVIGVFVILSSIVYQFTNTAGIKKIVNSILVASPAILSFLIISFISKPYDFRNGMKSLVHLFINFQKGVGDPLSANMPNFWYLYAYAKKPEGSQVYEVIGSAREILLANSITIISSIFISLLTWKCLNSIYSETGTSRIFNIFFSIAFPLTLFAPILGVRAHENHLIYGIFLLVFFISRGFGVELTLLSMFRFSIFITTVALALNIFLRYSSLKLSQTDLLMIAVFGCVSELLMLLLLVKNLNLCLTDSQKND